MNNGGWSIEPAIKGIEMSAQFTLYAVILLMVLFGMFGVG